MSSSPGRGQVEPLAALVAVFAVGVGLALYVGAVDATIPTFASDRELAEPTADVLVAEAADAATGTVDPPLEPVVDGARPTAHEFNATLRTDAGRWTAGPTRPHPLALDDCAQREVAVRIEPGVVRPGILEVCVWPADGG